MAIAYYYFGYVMMSLLHKLTGVTPGIAFGLSNAFWMALAAASAFGVVANLVLLFKEKARDRGHHLRHAGRGDVGADGQLPGIAGGGARQQHRLAGVLARPRYSGDQRPGGAESA